MNEVVDTPVIETEQPVSEKKKSKLPMLLIIVGILVLLWIIVRPGVFTIQPIGALPEGITLVYSGRSSEMPFYSSPDGICLSTQGSVSLLCRGAALSAAGELSDRIILRLPYSHWAYLQSTNGMDFEK